MERALVHAVQPRSCRRLFSITIASHGVCRRRRRSVAVDTLNTIVLMPALVVSVPPPPLLPEAVLIVVAVILVLLFLLVAIRFVSRQICSNLGFLGHAWRPVAMPRAIPSAHATKEPPRHVDPEAICSTQRFDHNRVSLDVTQRCVTFVARLLPGPVRRYPEPDDPADGEYSYLGANGSASVLDLVLRCPPSADRKYHSHIHVASSTPRRPQARLRMAGNRHNTDKRGHTRNSAGVVAQTPPTRHPTLAETCDACEASRVRKPQQT